ncbi:MAG: Hpt domain-containing protein [Bdellovibrionaceae bacterium]|nr:Hpt domain-containing protein [Bdellovibrionales bacterium]MCB9085655.1 Hpt domain-containing protein [Pseudobdellovibrionaceae bacterium]
MSFDRESFMSLIEGDKELFLSLLTLFEDDWPQLVEKIRSALQKGDKQTVEAMSHRLKGNLRNFYANQAAGLAQILEDAGKQGELDGKEPVLDDLVTQLNQVQADLRLFLKEMN